MKKFIIIHFLAFTLGFGRFLPVFYAPKWMHGFFSVWGQLLHIPALILLLGYLFFSLVKKYPLIRNFLFLAIYSLLWTMTGLLQELDNQIVIKVNNGRPLADFINPVLGMEMQFDSENNEVQFIFDNLGGIYEALIHSQNHGLSLDVYEIGHDATFRKIYDSDWYWYEKY